MEYGLVLILCSACKEDLLFDSLLIIYLIWIVFVHLKGPEVQSLGSPTSARPIRNLKLQRGCYGMRRL